MNRLNYGKELYLLSFNCGKTNDLDQIELLVLDRNTCNHLTVCKLMSSKK